MSRIGKIPILLPSGVKVEVKDGEVLVKGPKGELKRALVPMVALDLEDKTIHVRPTAETKKANAFHGLFRTLVNNMVLGVSQGFERKLEIVGVGYKAEVKGQSLNLALGFSHPIDFPLPEGIKAAVERTRITLTGIDKELLGQTAARIRGLRPPEPYKGKGIRYVDEKVRSKVGKAGGK